MIQHDPTRCDLCPCKACGLSIEVSLAHSRLGSAIQASFRRPRSKRLKKNVEEARAVLASAVEAETAEKHRLSIHE